jgi:hypothetical protein
MIPIKSNTNKENCVPQSSNCVIWQGPNLPCIGICTGDSVSDVIYRVAVELCDLKDSFGFTDVDLTCLLKICTTVPEPQKTLTAILNLVISKVCCLSDITDEILIKINTTPAEPEITLASCFHVTNPQGVPLTVLPVSAYVAQIGIKICDDIVPLLGIHSATLTSLQTQINLLPKPTPIPDIVPNCLTGNGVIPNVPTPIDVVVEELERQFCVLTDALGPTAEIIKVSGQCNLSTTPTDLNVGNFLSTGLPLVSNGNWNTTPRNLAETLQNLWLVACDLRGAVKLIQDNCCKISCKDILVNFDVLYSQTTDQATGKPKIVLTLFFGVDGVNIPSTFYDCDQTNFTELTITDQHGHSVIRTIKIRDITNQTGILDDPLNLGNGYDLVLLGTSLNPKDDLTITADVCLTDGTTSCIKCLNINVPYVSATCDYCKITASCDKVAANNTGFVILTYIDNETEDSQTTRINNCESIVIPHDITPVSYTASGPITLTSDCAGLIEAFQAVNSDLACYALVLTADQGQAGSDAPWMEGQVYVTGYKINGISYSTDNPNTAVVGANGEVYFGDLKTSIQNNSLVSSLFIQITTNVKDNDTYDGGLGSICFKTTTAIGDTMTVTVKSVLGSVKDPHIELKVQPISYYAPIPFAGLCECSVEPTPPFQP